MKRWLRNSSAVLLFAASAACGAPAATTTPKNPAAVATGSDPTAAEDPDLTPVSAPDDLIFVARWRRPANTIDTILAWTNLPIKWRSLLDNQLPSEGALTDVFALDTPADFAMTLGAKQMAEPDPQMVFTIGLQSVDAGVEFAEAMGESVEDIGNGIYAVGGGGEVECAIAPAAGAAKARLVCSDSAEAVDTLLPYVTRGLPTETLSKSDIHFELRVQPIHKAYGPMLTQTVELGLPTLLRELSLDDAAFDQAMANAVRGVTNELITLMDDLDTLTLDVDLVEDTETMDVTFAAQCRGTKSWTAQGIVDAKSRTRPAPREFWGLPADVPSASYASSPNPDRGRPIRKTTGDLLDALLNQGKLPERLRKDVRYIVDNTAISKAPRLVFQGSIPPQPKKPSQGEIASILSRLDSQWGWQVVGYLGEPSDGYKKYFDTWVKVYNDPAIKQLIKDKAPDLKASYLPQLRSKAIYAAGFAGSTQYEIILPIKEWTEGEAEDRKLVFIVMPDGKNTWVGFSMDEKILLKEMAKVKKPGQPLEGRAGLAALQKERHFSGGFFTTQHLLASILAGSLDMDQQAIERVFRGMPHRGDTPILTTIDYLDQNGPRFEMKVSAPKEVMQDVAASLPAMMGGFSF